MICGVKLIGNIRHLEGVQNFVLHGQSAEVFFEGTLVDRNLPGPGTSVTRADAVLRRPVAENEALID